MFEQWSDVTASLLSQARIEADILIALSISPVDKPHLP
jgi:hypothetical protein